MSVHLKQVARRNIRQVDPPRPTWIVLTEVVTLVCYSLLLMRLGWKLGLQMSRLQAWWMLVPAVICGYLTADFISGVVHWFGDSFYREDTPIVGTLLIKNFREHHRDPQSICRHGFLEVNANNCLGVIITLLIEVWVKTSAAGYPSLLVRSTLITYGLAMFGTNQFHKWAHAEHVPGIVAWLQRKNLILRPAEHQLHHRGGFDRSYCTTTGWMNLVLDRIGFFRRTEQLIRSLPWLANPSVRTKSRRA